MTDTARPDRSGRIAFALFLLSLVLLGFAGGYVVGEHQLFPYAILRRAELWFAEGPEDVRPWYFREVADTRESGVVTSRDRVDELNLVVQVDADLSLVARVLDGNGDVRHAWDLDWFRIWPDADHLGPRHRPRERPGTHVHGAALMENGDLVFNYEHQGLVRVDRDGEVVWRLSYQTHHSVHVHDDGTLWVCGQVEHTERDERMPSREPPFDENTILVVSPDGEILEEWSVPDLLRRNGLTGLLYLGSLRWPIPRERADVLHLNDVEPFPETLPEGFFRRGDVLVSLRNINAVFVFDRATCEIRRLWIGRFLRQHDPDFLDGDSFSVYDNNARPPELDPQSRILVVDAARDRVSVHFTGSAEQPFFSDLMGKHQWLRDGHLLITESMAGRAFELDGERRIVWEYVHRVEPGVAGLVEEVQRLPAWAGRRFGRE